MTSLFDLGVGEFDEFKRVIHKAGFSAELIRRVNGDPKLALKMREALEAALVIPTSFPVWKTIRIGGKNKDQLIAEIKAKGIRISDYARSMMDNEAFTTSTEPVELQLVRVTVAQLGLSDGATTREIWERALGLKLQQCPAEVGPHLRLQYPDQPVGEWVRIAMKQIVDSGGSPSVFSVDHDDGGRWLYGLYAHPEFEWNAGDAFAFVLPRA